VEKKPEARSKTTLIVKNIPYSTVDSELRDLFARFGVLERLGTQITCFTGTKVQILTH
jgi:RNA recognition motif-containing protein